MPRMIIRHTVKCDACGEELQRTNYYFKLTKHYFCNKECHGRWRAKYWVGESSPTWKNCRVTINCDICGKPVEYNRKEANKYLHHFCSASCRRKWIPIYMSGSNSPLWKSEKHITIPCTQCGKLISRWKTNSKHSIGNFCNHVCYGAWITENLKGEKSPTWGGGYDSDYGPNWQYQRNLARERDRFTCQRCGIDEKSLGKELDVHHLNPFRDFGLIRYEEANKLENLLSFCNICHTLVESLNRHSMVSCIRR